MGLPQTQKDAAEFIGLSLTSMPNKEEYKWIWNELAKKGHPDKQEADTGGRDQHQKNTEFMQGLVDAKKLLNKWYADHPEHVAPAVPDSDAYKQWKEEQKAKTEDSHR